MYTIRTHQDVENAFEELFHTYETIQQLPRFKKKICCKKETAKLANHQSQSGNQFQNKAQDAPQGKGEEQSMLSPRRSYQMNFSSGVFSLDSDGENEPMHAGDDATCTDELSDTGNGCATRVKDTGLEHEDGTYSESDSGIISTHSTSSSHLQLIEDACDGATNNRTGNNDLLKNSSCKLTDEDVLFMMHKPRLKRRRKKPSWQRRKLDLDDLWLRGQHRWCMPKEEQDKAFPVKLYLNRNLRWGKISLVNYLRTVEKSKKIRIHPNKRKNNSMLDTRLNAKGSRKRLTNAADPASYTHSPNQTGESKVQNSLLKKNAKKHQTQGNGSASKHGKTLKTLICKQTTSNVFCDGSSETSEDAKKKQKPLKGQIDKFDGDINGGSVSDEDTGSSNESSVIQFVSLTPKRSKQKRHQMKKHSGALKTIRKTGLVKVSGSSKYLTKGTGRPPSGREYSLTSDASEGDDIDSHYQPLFRHSRHCGGVWKSIVEEL